MSNWDQVVKQAAIRSVNDAASKIKRFTGRTAAWRNKCLKRDNYRCLLCGGERDLHVHHLERWHDAPHRRLEVNNGATLCKSCHEENHNGKGDAFPAQVTKELRDRIAGRPPWSQSRREGIVLIKHYCGITPPSF